VNLQNNQNKSQTDMVFYKAIRPAGVYWSDNLFYSRFIKLYSFVLSVAKKMCSPEGAALDAATGMGYGAKMLDTYYKKVYGIDISSEAVVHAKSNYKGPEFQIGNVLDLQFEDGLFESVFSIETMEHLQKQDLNVYFSELVRVTKPGGLIIISTPNKPIYSSLHMVKDHYSELDFLELKSLLNNVVGGDIDYYEFGATIGRRLQKLKRIEKISTFARKVYGRVFRLPFPQNLSLEDAIEFWDVNPIEDSSMGYLNVAVVKKP
jgi:2-polyprenyl-3-methyl-5-hydroxy-6-metoxy-1,4-benzoquinol methylase